jgi:arginine-tRNA-protein transferase
MAGTSNEINSARTITITQVLHQLPIAPPHPCAYIPGQIAADRGFAVSHMESTTWEALLELGWRRAGGMIYTPSCPLCRECTPLRIPVAEFKPNRSQRRTLKRNGDLVARIQPLCIDKEHAQLYQQYVRTRHEGMMSGSVRELRQFLGISPVDTFEIEVRRRPKKKITADQVDPHDESDWPLVSVMVVDRTPRAWNAVYHYFDQNEPNRSLGTWTILKAIELCRERCPAQNDARLYLGYWVPNSQKMGYKAGFQPHEIRLPAGQWRRVDERTKSSLPIS